MGKSVYVSETGGPKKTIRGLGGKKSHLRALTNVEPFMKNIKPNAHQNSHQKF